MCTQAKCTKQYLTHGSYSVNYGSSPLVEVKDGYITLGQELWLYFLALALCR